MYKSEPLLLSALSDDQRQDSPRFDATDGFDAKDHTLDNLFDMYPHCNTVLLLEKIQQCPIGSAVLIPDSFWESINFEVREGVFIE
jgi:hypothetical protein